jgi:hypothetical protein
MRFHWMTAALLSSALVVGCGDRSSTNDTIPEENSAAPVDQPGTGGEVSAPVAVEPAPPAASPNRDTARPAQPRRQVTTPPPPQVETSSRQPAPRATAAPTVQAPRWRELTLPAGTALPLELTTAVSSETATVETPVRGRLRQGVTIDGTTVLPAGTVLYGQVIDVERAGRVQGRARLVLRFTEAELDGARESVRTNPITFEGEATKGEDATKIGAGAGIGAVIGGILGGGDGAAKGAAIGGAAGTGAVLATRGREVTLASGADLPATLASAATIRVETR